MRKRKPYTLDDLMTEQEKRFPGFKKRVAKELKKIKQQIKREEKKWIKG